MVVAFHGGLPVPGGFVGVDVFFVISGFVITGMIHREHSATGRFNFARFYFRRFKRLTPALALTVAVTMILAFCLLPPFSTQQTAAQTGVGAMLLVANFVIDYNTGDYFDLPAESNPLLHTWSLSVEEQFYLVFPAILFLGWLLCQRRGGRTPWVTVLVATAAAASFGLAAIGNDAIGSPAGKYLLGFYSPATRAWEFALGALLALATTSRSLRSARIAHAAAWIGAALLAASAWLIHGGMPFPGPWTLLPVCGTLLLIAAGTRHNTPISRALALPAVVKIGDWSYSIYLWHWPLKVFAVHLLPGKPFVAAIAATLSILPAVASYRWVEQPLRRLPALSRGRSIALVGAVVCPSILLAVTCYVGANDYWLPRYSSGAVPVTHQGDTDWTDFYKYLSRTYFPCSDQPLRDGAPKWKGIVRCHQSKPDSHINVALLGDSHAEHLFLGLAEALPDKNVVYYIRGIPVRSVTGMSQIIDHVGSDPAVQAVILTAEWVLRGVAPDELVKTLETFKSKGKAVFVTDDVPTFDFEAESCKYRIAPVVPFPKCSEDRELFEARRATYIGALRDAVGKVPGVQLLNTAEYFCDERVCSMNRGDALLYRDTNHLNNNGSRFLAERMLADFPEFRVAVGRP
ncbi:hypothetical protein A5673_21345 [Mycobacterium sp. E3198]|nr:hypothetical protein A5673_21345 [Mycobacterium sp. E3198]